MSRLRPLRTLALWAACAIPSAAQVNPLLEGPPACPHPRKATAHPAADEIRRTEALAAADPTVLLAPEPVGNMGLLRYAVRDYADCTTSTGCYWSDLAAQTRRAQSVLEEAARAVPRATKKALVLDIDETSLSSYCEEVSEDFGYIPDRFEAWIVSDEASIPIPGTVALVKRAQELGVDVFFITGRPESQRAATERNLRTAGYSDWKHLALKQATDAGRSTADYKAAERAKIVADGYTLLLNMGDQWSDLQGTPQAQHSVKLPNPFYYLP
jgi:hypothetical protein